MRKSLDAHVVNFYMGQYHELLEQYHDDNFNGLVDNVGACLGAERYAEEFGRFVAEECVPIGIFIYVF